uniref:Xcc-b100_2016 protein n=1 Tax=Fopius arisanus TaxID=64838 RepID=A0A0C9R855_9HYME
MKIFINDRRKKNIDSILHFYLQCLNIPLPEEQTDSKKIPNKVSEFRQKKKTIPQQLDIGYYFTFPINKKPPLTDSEAPLLSSESINLLHQLVTHVAKNK